VLHLRDTREIGGPGKTILETHRAIDPGRFELHLAVFATRVESGDTPFVQAARQAGLPTHLVRGFNQYDPRMIGEVSRLVERLEIGIVHAHEVKSDVIAYLASRIRPVPIVTTLHGWIGNGLKQRAFIALDKRVVRGFDRVIAVSREIEQQLLAAGVRSEAIRLIHNAIVVEKYRKTGRTGLVGALVGGAPLAGPIVVSVGRLSPEKGHADLIDALAPGWRRGGRV
jgi:glycosyltransferase involved in cell wall biosynthesis